MDKFFEDFKFSVVNYRLKTCCCVVPLRTGLLAIGYFNLLLSMILIIGTASDSFSPTIKHVQAIIMDGDASTTTCILVPSTELAFTVLLLCAMHREDVVLLRFYMYYGMAAVTLSVIVYSIMFAVIDVLYIILIMFNILYQIYVIILVRSVMVEIRLRDTIINGHIIQTYHLDRKSPDAEAAEVTLPDDKEQPKEPENKVEPKVETEDEKAIEKVKDSNVASAKDTKAEPEEAKKDDKKKNKVDTKKNIFGIAKRKKVETAEDNEVETVIENKAKNIRDKAKKSKENNIDPNGANKLETIEEVLKNAQC